MIERTATEAEPTVPDTAARYPLFGDDCSAIQLRPDPAQGLAFEIEPKYQTHRLGFDLVYHQLAIAPIVAQRRRASHPHPLLLGGCNLVADALAGHLAFELGKREQHVQ